jgi:putative beta-lysine N-acetyltransferase
MAKFFSDKRKFLPNDQLNIFQNILNKKINIPENKTINIKQMTEKDLDNMVDLYKLVFPTYPFPITDKNYLKKTMDDNIYYYGIYDNEKLIALSSSETNKKHLNVEMTDFAVLPEYRGKNLSYYLLKKMEKDMQKLGFKTFYTIARLKSPGMNLTFIKNGYKYSGTLVNNTNISGNIESMNIFYKNV